MITVLKKAIKHWGAAAQERKAIEEMAELIVELSRPEKRKDRLKICEEIADVQIMLDQLRLIYSVNDIIMFRDVKMNRLENYLKELELDRFNKESGSSGV